MPQSLDCQIVCVGGEPPPSQGVEPMGGILWRKRMTRGPCNVVVVVDRQSVLQLYPMLHSHQTHAERAGGWYRPPCARCLQCCAQHASQWQLQAHIQVHSTAVTARVVKETADTVNTCNPAVMTTPSNVHCASLAPARPQATLHNTTRHTSPGHVWCPKCTSGPTPLHGSNSALAKLQPAQPYRKFDHSPSSPARASSPLVGSSMNTTLGFATSSTAMVRRLRCSTDRPH